MKTPVLLLIALLWTIPPAMAEEMISCGKGAMEWHPTPLPAPLKEQLQDELKLNADKPGAFKEPFVSIRAADLNDNHGDELLISSATDGTKGQNTNARIYERRGKLFNLLFEGFISLSDYPVIILPSLTNGYHDICAFQTYNSTTRYVTVLKYDGNAYKNAQCREEEFSDYNHAPKISIKKCVVNP